MRSGADGAHRAAFRGAFVLFSAVLALAAGAAAAQPSSVRATATTTGAGPANAEPADAQPFALTISGGVSLGSYEAGVNWALLEVLRSAPADANFGRPTLTGVTGASAGSINALLTVMHWCEGGTTSLEVRDPERNLFAQTWLPIGLATLVPANRVYEGGTDDLPDALLSRSAFRQIRDEVHRLVSMPRYRPGCSMSLGLTVTRIVPSRVQTAGLSVDNQRFVVPLRATVGADGRLHFWNDVRPHRAELVGTRIFLANRGGSDSHPSVEELSVATVVEAVLASSAFPVAFGPVRLDYFTEHQDCATRLVRRGRGFLRCSDWFVDGGVFDNIPLGLAIAQIESHVLYASTPRPVRYLYIDSANRRHRIDRAQTSARAVADKHCARRRGAGPISRAFSCWKYTFSGAVGTARGYELHNVLRYNAWNRGSTWVAREAASRLAARARMRPSEIASGRSSLAACLGHDLSVFEVPIAETPAIPFARLAVCYQRASAVHKRRYLAALADQLLDWSGRLDAARLSATSTRADHERVRGAILRSVAGLPGLVGHTSAIGATLTVDQLAAEALLLASDPGAERILYPSRRFFPLASTYAANFSGFLDPPLRRYDYLIGVYDALHSAATAVCEQRSAKELTADSQPLEQPAMQDCVDRWLTGFQGRLGLARGPVADFLRLLTAIESAYWRGRPPVPVTGSDDLAVILRALTRSASGPAELQLEDTDLPEFVAALKRERYKPRTAEMEAAMRDPELWWSSLSVSLLARQRELEPAGFLSGTMFAGERMMASLERAQEEGFLLQQASIPRYAGRGWHVLRLLPHHVATSAGQERLLDAGWQVGLAKAGFRVSLEPRFWIGYGEPGADIGLDLSYHARSITGHLLFSSFGVAPGYTAVGANRDLWRVEIYMTTLSNRIRFALGTNSLTSQDGQPWGELLYGSVGFSDFPGLIYSALHRVSWMLD